MARVWRFIVKHKYPLALLVIDLIVFHEWFFSFSNLTWGDWWFFSSKGLLTIPYMWDAGTLFGLPLAPSFYPISALGGLLANMGFGFPVIERVLYMWPAVIVGSLGSYYLCRRITKSELAAFVGSIVYVFNTYALRLASIGHFRIFAAFSFAPLILLFFMKALNEKKYHYAILTGLLSCIASFYDPRVCAIIAIVMVLYAVYHTLFMEKMTAGLALKNARLTLVPMALVLLTNMYWLLGYWMGGGFSSSPAFTRALAGPGLRDFRHAVALYDGEWISSPSVSWFFYLIPVLALLGLVLGRKNRNVVFFGVVALIGILLAKQAGQPFPGLYSWMFNHVPGFKMFREASKFYLLICFGYSVLIAYLAKWLGDRLTRRTWDKAAKYAVVALVLFLFLFNAVSIVTGNCRLCIPRKMPDDYRILNEFVSEQNSYFRTLGVPMSSRWVDQTQKNPMIDCHDFMYPTDEIYLSTDTSWARFIGTIKVTAANPLPEIYTGFIGKPYFGELLADGAFKYVIVPVRDIKNDDDFFGYWGINRDAMINALDKAECLKRIDIGTKELAVYEYKGFRPYMYSEDTVFSLDTLSGLDEKYRFAANVLNDRSAFVEGKDASSAGLTMLNNLFEPSEQAEVSVSGAAITDEVDVGPGARNNNVFENTNRRAVSYEAGGGRLQVFSSSIDNLFLNGAPLHFPAGVSGEPVATTAMDPQRDYYLSLGGSMVPVVTGPPRAAGVLAPGQELSLLSSPMGSLVPNGSFEQGPWNEKVLDFNNYDKNPILGMRIAEGRSEGTKAIQLEAARHIAATAQNGIPVNPGSSYLFSIDYQSPNGGNGEYVVSFNPGGTQTKETLTMSDTKWHTTSTLIRPPEGTTSLNLALLCSPKAEGQKSIVRYDNVKLEEMSVVASYRATGGEGFDSVSAPLKPGKNNLEFRDSSYTFSNLIQNGSFEQGPWNEKVQDFHNYDKNPILGMRIAEGRSEGTKAIQLEAARHIAATSMGGIPVNPGSSYLISIDYQSPNGGNGEYEVSFNPGGTQTKETLTMSDTKWHTTSTLIRPPEGTTSLNLALLCSPKAEGQKSIVRYDNVRLTETPDFLDYYYLVSAPGKPLKSPGKIEFESVNPTKKVVRVKSASTPFFLSMSESYHTGWRATVASKGKGSYLIPESDHLKLDEVSNAWFVDLLELQKRGLARGNADGTYDLDLVIEFTPQRYTNIGFVISLIALLAAIAYLVLDWRKRRAQATAGLATSMEGERARGG
jgi:hypothetical protein